MTVGDPFALWPLFAGVAQRRGDQVSIIDDRGVLSWDDLLVRVDAAQRRLQRAGLQPGHVVGVQSGNGADTLAALMAGWRRGVIPVNINRRYRPSEVAELLDAHDIAGLVTSPDAAGQTADLLGSRAVLVLQADGLEVVGDLTDDIPADVGSDAYLLLTGGTTGKPKLVEWAQADLFVAAVHPRHLDPVTSAAELWAHADRGGPTILTAAPLDHAFGQWVALSTLLGGGRLILTERQPFDPGQLLDLCERESVEVLNIAGQAFALGLADALDAGAPPPRSLRRIVTGGAATQDKVKRRLWNRLPDTLIVEGVGASETGTLGRAVQSAAYQGDLSPCFEASPGVTVIDQEGAEVAVGSRGLLARRGTVARRYRGAADASAGVFSVRRGQRTAVLADAAERVGPQSFMLRGRIDDVINTGGEKVHPAEVTSVLLTHPDIDDVVVVGEPDDRLGHRVAALIRLSPGVTRDDPGSIRQWAGQRIAGYKVPRRVVLVDVVPRLGSGKPDLAGARELLSRSTTTGDVR